MSEYRIDIENKEEQIDRIYWIDREGAKCYIQARTNNTVVLHNGTMYEELVLYNSDIKHLYEACKKAKQLGWFND